MSRFAAYYAANRDRRKAEAKAYAARMSPEERHVIKVTRTLGVTRQQARILLSGRDWLIVGKIVPMGARHG